MYRNIYLCGYSSSPILTFHYYMSLPLYFHKLTRESVSLLSSVQLFVTPWVAAPQASLSITNSQSLLKFMSVKLVMPSNHLILCGPLLLLLSIFPSIGSFPESQFFTSGGQSIGASMRKSMLG